MSDGRDEEIGGDGVVGVHPAHHAAVRGGVRSAGVNVLVIRHGGEGVDLPAEQLGIKELRAFGLVGRDFEPDEAGRGGGFFCGFGFGFGALF